MKYDMGIGTNIQQLTFCCGLTYACIHVHSSADDYWLLCLKHVKLHLYDT